MDGKTQTVTTYTEVTSAMTADGSGYIDWSAGTYVVKTSTELNGCIRTDGGVVIDLILCNDATLTVNGSSNGAFDPYTLNIYAQSTGATMGVLTANKRIKCSNLNIAGGIVGMAYGTTSITDCHSSINIHSSINGDGTHGGIMSCSWTGSTTNITGCLFDGSIQSVGENVTTHSCGGFVGWKNATINVSNCLLTADLSTIVDPEGLQYPSLVHARRAQASG